VEKAKSKTVAAADAQALAALEQELGESVLYRATGRFLSAQGVDIPLGSWGLIALTATRITFHHYAQAHPLFGGRDGEVRFELPRSRFATCQLHREGFWSRLFSGTPDHLALRGDSASVSLEVADNQSHFVEAWMASRAP
jgi:hypothetical protein